MRNPNDSEIFEDFHSPNSQAAIVQRTGSARMKPSKRDLAAFEALPEADLL
jgi:hypothetical protein